MPTAHMWRKAWALQTGTTFDPITVAFDKAVPVMQAGLESDPTSWTYQAAIHASFATPPPSASWDDCQHQSWFFLPWHRMYRCFFERVVRQTVTDVRGRADFALPHWNDNTLSSQHPAAGVSGGDAARRHG